MTDWTMSERPDQPCQHDQTHRRPTDPLDLPHAGLDGEVLVDLQITDPLDGRSHGSLAGTKAT
jgi:hypothetical protein